MKAVYRTVFVLFYCGFEAVWGNGLSNGGKPGTVKIECPPADAICEKDKFGFEAIKHLHLSIDDDGNGNLDREESDEFLRDELKYEDDFERHSTFHGNDDLISVSDLWVHWVKSEVYNWTVDDVLEWLVEDLELPQYIECFKLNEVDGHALPRIAANSQYTTNILGIKNAIHRQKIALKAMDVVLFGPPKRHNYIKDLLLVGSLVIAVGGCWLAYVQNRYSQSHLKKVMKDLEALQKSEDTLTTLQKKLDDAQKKQQRAMDEKNTFEKKLKNEILTAKSEADKLRSTRETTEEEISRLRLAEEELIQVRMALRRAEREIEERHTAPLAELQQWLQLTYEVENRHYEIKREAAEHQLNIAKEMCEKIRRKRGAFLGSLRIAHTTSIDNTDDTIIKARVALEEIKTDLQERSQRWAQIEKICGFNIIMNPGIQFLESLLRGGSGSMLSSRTAGLAPMDVESADEDMPPGYVSNAVFLAQNSANPVLTPTLLRHSGSTSASTSQLSGKVRTDSYVWPSLMQAGMQLTMVGLGAANKKAMPPHPKHTFRRTGSYSTMPDLRERRTPGTPSSSSNMSLGGTPLGAPVPSHVIGNHPERFTTKTSKSESSIKGSDCDSQHDSDGSNNDSSQGRESNGGPVVFNLGETRLSQDSGDMRRNHSFGQSISLEAAGSKPAIRPKTLPSSLSEGMLSGHVEGKRSTPTQVVKRSSGLSSNSGNQTPSLQEEENSSPESTDGSSVSEDRKTKKSKGKFLRKLLGKESDKSK